MEVTKEVAAFEREVRGDEQLMVARRAEDGAVIADTQNEASRCVDARALPCSAHPGGLRGAYLVNKGEFAEGLGHGLRINGGSQTRLVTAEERMIATRLVQKIRPKQQSLSYLIARKIWISVDGTAKVAVICHDFPEG